MHPSNHSCSAAEPVSISNHQINATQHALSQTCVDPSALSYYHVLMCCIKILSRQAASSSPHRGTPSWPSQFWPLQNTLLASISRGGIFSMGGEDAVTNCFNMSPPEHFYRAPSVVPGILPRKMLPHVAKGVSSWWKACRGQMHLIMI